MYRGYSDKRKSILAASIGKIRKEKLRTTARRHFFEGISISGLIEYYHAPTSMIRFMWIMALAASTGSIFYHTFLLITSYQNQGSTYDFIQTDKEIIPFPKVTVCAPTGLNRTWIYQYISLPSRDEKLIASFSQKEKEVFLEAATSLMGNSFRYIVDKGFKQSDRHYFAINRVITQTLIKMNGSTQAFKFGGALPTCEETVSNCQLGGTVFDCCNNSVRMIDDDGPCYDLQVDKMDELLNRPRSNATPISFTFNLKMNWNHMFDYSTINGFSIHISDPYSPFGRPIAVPAATHTMVDISRPTLRRDKSDCFNQKKLPDTSFGPYDANGYNCKIQRYFEEVVTLLMGCTYVYGAYVPEDAHMCTGSQATPMKLMFAYGDNTNQKLERSHQEILFEITHSKTRCLPLCTAWEYTPRPSFSDLMRDDYTTPIGRNNTDNVTLSRVTVFIGSTYYIEKPEEQRPSPYRTFVQITEVCALYVGFSVITVAEILFHGCQLCCVYKKTRNKPNRVGFID